MMTRERLERLAIEAHEAGTTWVEFWPTVAGAVAASGPNDYFARGRLVHRLVGLVAAGDLDGRPIDSGYGRPLDFELEAIEATR